MSLYKKIVKLFLHSKVLIAIYAIFNIYVVYQAIKFIPYTGSEILPAMQNPLSLSIYAFVVFAFLSFEFFSLARRDNLIECLKTTKSGYRKTICYQFLVMATLVLVFAALMLIWNVIIAIITRAFTLEIIIHIFINWILNFILIPIMAVLLGLSLSLTTNRFFAYLTLVILTILISPFANMLGATVYDLSKINIYPVINMFEIFTPSLTFTSIGGFGQSILPYRWEILGFWCFLFLFVAALKLFTRGSAVRKGSSITSIMLSAICLFSFFQPASKVLLESYDPVNSSEADYEYYYEEKNGQKEENPLFSISEYDLELKVGEHLKAKATLSIDNWTLTEYIFTLYHGYKINKVTDENNKKLSFSRDGDYFKVVRPDNQEIKQIIIHYSGFSPVYYSNNQGIFLPGFFAYYPHAGYFNIYDQEQRGVSRVILEQPTTFNVKVKSNKTVYCNLKETSKNTFSGSSTGLTLISGFYKDVTINGVKFVYPYLNAQEYTADALNQFAMNRVNTEAIKTEHKTVFFYPGLSESSPYTRYATFSDHVAVDQLNGFQNFYDMQKPESHKQPLEFSFRTYISDPQYVRASFAEWIEMIKSNPELYGETKNSNVRLIFFLDHYGEEEGIAKVEQYLNDKNDKTHWLDFITKLD